VTKLKEDYPGKHARSDLRSSASSTATDTITANDIIIPYDDAVSEGKKIVAQINDVTEHGHWRLGELADKADTKKYKDRTQANLAKEWGIAACTLKRYVSVYPAYKGLNIGAPGPQSGSYSVRRELETHPDRGRLIRENPTMTKRDAQELMREHKGKGSGKGDGKGTGGFSKDNRPTLKPYATSAKRSAVRLNRP
jgi:hypothetical protein